MIGHMAKVCRRTGSTQSSQPAPSRGARGSGNWRGRGRGGRGRPLRQLEQQSQEGREDDLDVMKITPVSEPIKASVKIHNGENWHPIKIEVDTGAAPTTFAERHYKAIVPNLQIEEAPATLRNYDGTPITGVIGIIRAEISFGNRKHSDVIHIVRDPAPAVLGKNYLIPLDMAIYCGKRDVQAVREEQANPLKKFPRLISPKLGTFPRYQHQIRLTGDVATYATRL